ncbi:MAG: sigma-70 family RNA polymerase sigma factor [Planctomycetia bacterium]|jgi:RNA polymerase sigma-70 factor (ECF subfamily)
MDRFATTRWSLVLVAKRDAPTARRALAELCEIYYEPVHAFVAKTIFTSGEARDVTHDFFEWLLEKNRLARLEPGQGKFRSYLLGAVKHFLSQRWQKLSAQKRGGRQEPVSLDGMSEDRTIPDPDAFPADAFFDRQWAVHLVEKALDTLAAEQGGEPSRQQRWETLKPWLTGKAMNQTQEEAARSLGISIEAVKVNIHRLRKSFREILCRSIAETVESPEEIPAELDYLIQACTQASLE